MAAFEGRVERGAATAVAPVRPQEPKALEGHFPSRGEGEGGGEREGLHGEGGAEVTRKDCRWNNEVGGGGGRNRGCSRMKDDVFVFQKPSCPGPSEPILILPLSIRNFEIWSSFLLLSALFFFFLKHGFQTPAQSFQS